MKTNRDWRIGSGGETARSVLECGGKRSATPLFLPTGTEANEENEGWLLRFLWSPRIKVPVLKRRRRCALPAQPKTWRVFATLLFLFIALGFVRAQNFSIDWFTIDGGGGTSTGGVYSVSGTIGQANARKFRHALDAVLLPWPNY